MKELPEVLMREIFQFLNKEGIENLKKTEVFYVLEFLEETKEYLLTTKDRDWEKLDKAKLFFKLAKSEDITSQEIIKIVNGFTLDNGASKVQVLKALASNKELFKTLSRQHKQEIVDFVIFPMGMSRQEEENNKPEMERNQEEMAEILGISGIYNVVAVSIGCGSECVIS